MVRFTTHTSSFREIRDSRFYLDLKKNGCRASFEIASTNSCQWWLMMMNACRKSVQTAQIYFKSKSAMAIPWRNRTRICFTVGERRLNTRPNVTQMKDWWWRLGFLKGFLQNFVLAKNARWECVCILYGRLQLLGFKCDRRRLIRVCLALVN